MMARCRALLVAALALSAAPAAASGGERIVSFDSNITIAANSELEVRETIVVEARGETIRRGIYRDFPTRYRRADGQPVVVGFKLRYAERDGRIEPSRTESQANGIRIYIGDPERLVAPGRHEYVIVYSTDRQLGFFADHDELYWNVTGNGWALPIETASARVQLPAQVAAGLLALGAYTGLQGERGTDFSAEANTGQALFVTTRSLQPREGFTIVVGWPKGIVAPPSAAMRARYLLRDVWLALLAATGLLSLAAYYYYAWNRVGRDPARRLIVPHYSAPEGHSAAAMRYLCEMSYDDRCFAAGILSLAVKGHLRIDRTSGGMFGQKKDYVLQRCEPDTKQAALSGDEQPLLAELLGARPSIALQNKNHEILRMARDAHEAALRNAYKNRFFHINGLWHGLGVALSIVLLVLLFFLGQVAGLGAVWLFRSPAGWATLLVAVLALALNGVFGKLLKAPTVAGQRVMEQILGFKMYLGIAEGEALKLQNAPKMTASLFESYLPAALALGVEQSWAEKFATLLATDPATASVGTSWYSGNSWQDLGAQKFTDSIGSSLTSAISSASSPPGSSSGGGGGGSSGGGGGGGGGGGW
ncbi:MAG: DUF2207 domain-containing protein [Steroidobacteraceae bacterium]